MARDSKLRVDYASKQFGLLTVVRLAGRIRRNAQWECLCACGKTTIVSGSNLKSGSSKSCGCLRREATSRAWTRHGHNKPGSRSREYHSWSSMWSRVRATAGERFKLWASRGIAVCERWESFERFLADMGPRPDGTSLDRIDNNGNYEPSNCRWATASQQVGNRRYLGRNMHEELET